MRKGFQKLAAELLVEATQQDDTIANTESPGAVVTVDTDSEERRYYVKPEDVASLEQTIDLVGLSTAEIASGKEEPAPPNLGAVQAWIEACTKGEDESYNRLKKIFETNLLRDRSRINDFGKYQDAKLTSGKTYGSGNPLVLDLARFVPTVSAISRTTGPGEFAVAFLFGLVPARETGFDLVTAPSGSRQYTIKHASEAPEEGLRKFVYKFQGRKRNLKRINDALDSNESITKNDAKLMYSTREKFRFNLTKDEKAAQESRRALTKRELAYVLLDLMPRNRRGGGTPAPTRWALICNNPPPKSQDSAQFTFKAFSLSSRIEAVETTIESGTESKIVIDKTQITIFESASAGALINELSRRDQEQVTAIARRIAQEVLEDELGDDFDKAVRREMAAGFKDPDVESAAADVTKDYLRKFYRSLGVSSSSPLDKVKI